jgi:hypothetical protein
MSLKRKFYRSFLIFKNHFGKLDFTPPEKLTANQELGIKIFEKSLIIPGAELLIAPISGTYYIKTEDIFIVLDGNELRIVNGRYEYHISLTMRSYEKLTDRFKRILESRRKKMEQSMLSKTNRSLSEILQDVSEKSK